MEYIKMTRKFFALTVAAILTGSAFAQALPSHYPERFQRTGTIDDVQPGTVVVNDVLYSLSEEVVVHSYLSEQDASIARLRKGIRIGFEVGENRQLTQIWMLPSYYDERSNRR